MDAKAVANLKSAAIGRYVGHLGGIHGISHWERVRENGARLAGTEGADAEIIEAFAYLHDCCRENDGSDYDHGLRAAGFAIEINAELLGFAAERLEILTFACEHHAKGFTSECPTVGACWDSDRLDLGRVGAVPDPHFLSTAIGKTRETIDWAYARSLSWEPFEN